MSSAVTYWPEVHKWLRNRGKRADDHAVIAAFIKRNTPFLLTRLGTGEVRALRGVAGNEEMCTRNLGIIPPSEEQLEVYRKRYTASVLHCDVLGVWNGHKWFPNERRELARMGNPKCAEVFAEAIGDLQYYLDEHTRPKSWFAALGGKKVLVVHSFAETMKKQYDSKVFTYPAFASLQFIRASNTQSERTDEFTTTWTAELAKMESEMAATDFDIALIGCGAYSGPLGDYAKQTLKKSAMVMGSALQLYFGILGKRWEEHPDYAHLRAYWNERWIRPADDEKPKNYKKIEGGAYW